MQDLKGGTYDLGIRLDKQSKITENHNYCSL
jgi:hypothetical protein